jgi:hypothetical protein
MTSTSRFQVHSTPIRLFFSPAPWAATAYLASYLVIGPLLFAAALTVVTVAFGLSITVLGLPLLIGAALIIRGLSQLERARALIVATPIPYSYAPVDGSGLLAQIRTRWSDRSTLAGCAYLILMFPLLLVVDIVALALWLAFLSGIALPLWYWAIPQTWNNGKHDRGVMLGYLPDGPHT